MNKMKNMKKTEVTFSLTQYINLHEKSVYLYITCTDNT